MEVTFDRTTIDECMPLIREIAAEMDVSLKLRALASRTRLNVYGLSDRYGYSQIARAASILCHWVRETGIERDTTFPGFQLVATRSGGWERASEILAGKVREHGRPASGARQPRQRRPAGLSFSPEGDIRRGRRVYQLRAPLRLAIVSRLIDAGDGFVRTDALREAVGCRSEDALRKAIAAINAGARAHLGTDDGVIEARPMSGYRMNPKWRPVRAK